MLKLRVSHSASRPIHRKELCALVPRRQGAVGEAAEDGVAVQDVRANAAAAHLG